ncbi:RHS repeat-associated core domain-containing protein [Prosthecobacter sp.]|uniref:RHS repeat-associated core domain-containing protein n=1 Tax=Prosthecobacter sp. TaxID=1965333 RepID=UPI00378530F9
MGTSYEFIGQGYLDNAYALPGDNYLYAQSRSERWTGAGTQVAWSESFESEDGSMSATVDQTYVATLSSSATLTGGLTARDSWRRLVSEDNTYGTLFPVYAEGVMFPLWRTTTADAQGRTVSETSKYSESGTTIQTIITTYAGETGYTRSAGDLTLSSQGDDVVAGGLRTSTSTDILGITTTTVTDETTGEVVSETRLGLTTNYTKATGTDGSTTQTVTQTADGITRTMSVTVTDAQGRTVSSTDANGGVTTYSYANNGRTVTETLPGGGTRITENYLDGQLKSITGTAVTPEYHSYTVTDGSVGAYEAGSITETVYYGTDSGAAWRKTTTNYLGQVLREEAPSPTGTGVSAKVHTYNAKGQRVKTSSPGMADLIIAYDGWGRVSQQGYDMDADGVLTVSSTDVLSTSSTDYVTGEGTVLEQVVRQQYTQDGDDTTLETKTERKLLEGSSWQRSTQADGGVFTQFDVLSGSIRTIHGQQSVTGTQSQVQIYQNDLLMSETPPGMTSAVTYTYNGFGQVETVVHPLNGTITHTYDTAGRVLTQGQTGGDTVTYAYNSQGQVASETHSDSSTTTYTYDAQGRVLTQGGTAGYPLGYEYDAMGRLWKLHTYRGGSADDVTTWTYDAASGVLVSKTDAAGRSVGYTYDTAGRVLTRAWQRGVTTTYSYDAMGRHTGIDYSDSTPDVSFTYDRAGRRTGTTDAAGTHAFTYDDAASGGRVSGWSVSGTGAWTGLSMGYGNTAGKRSSRATSLGAITLPTVNYTYEAGSGRMAGVSASDFAVTYSYDAATGWNSGVTYSSGLSSTRTADALGRLDAITWSVGGVTVSGHDYTLNALNRRTAAQRQDGSSWSYGYNARGEVTNAAKGTEPGKQFAFAYDGIGNRTSSSVSSIASTSTLRTTGYSANALNQYDSITHPQPGWLVLRGSANTAAGTTVTIDGNAPTLTTGTLWFYEQSVDNTEGPVRREVEITATRPDGGVNNGPVTTQQQGALFIPPPSEVPTYDLDGNLTSDARWNYVWNGENRLVAQEEKNSFIVQPTSITPVKRTRLEFDYDARGRRIGKRTFIATGSGGFVLQQSLVELYDGWNMIAEIDTTSSTQLLRSYEWGTDISETMQGAGGVGGLLIERFHTIPSSVVQVPCYDGNGNVTELVNPASGTMSARYEYGSFGETISIDGGAVAEANPFRFSTKYLDGESGFYNYGYRLYDAPNARWLSRDPIKERGGINLYGMVGNDALNQVDILGLATFEIVLKRNLTGNFAVYGELSASLKLNRAEEAKFACCTALVPLKFITLETVGKPLKEVGTYTPYTSPENSWANGTGANGTGFPKDEDGEFIGRFTSIRGKLEFITMMQWISPGSGRLPQKPSEMSQSDYDDIVNQEFHPDINKVKDGRNIHFWPTANHSTGCVLIGTSYIPVISPFDGDRFGLAARNGIGTQYRVPGFGLQDTIDSQFKLLRAVQCATKQGAKLQYKVLNEPPPLHPDAQAMPHKENERGAPPRAFPLNF